MYAKSSGYYNTATSVLSLTSPEQAVRLHSLLKSLNMRPGHLLDCGCANGHLMYHMRELGWKMQGIDINPDSIRIARSNGLEAHCSDLHGGRFADEEFDVVFMGDTIEHILHPRDTCREVLRILRPGGVFIVETPNCLCGYSQLSLRLSRSTGLAWLYSLAPYHLYEFSPMALELLLENSDFDVERLLSVKRVPRFLRLVGETGFVDDVKLSMKTAEKYRGKLYLLYSLPRLALVASLVLPLYFGSMLYDKLHHLNRGITAVARKPQ